MSTRLRTVFAVAAVLAAGVFLTGCNNTIQQISIPSNAAWHSFLMGFVAQYGDLEIIPSGNDIAGAFLDFQPVTYCSDGTASTFVAAGEPCPAGYTVLGERYWYVFVVSIDRPAFQAGGVDLVSASAGTIYSLSLAVNTSTNNVFIAAGASDGVIPLGSQQPPTPGEVIVVDDYAFVALYPHSDGFEPAVYGDPVWPDFLCELDGDNDVIAMKMTTPRTAAYACGAFTFNLAISPPYPNLGQCISQSILLNCRDQGLTGKPRATCNKQQQSVCAALFNR